MAVTFKVSDVPVASFRHGPSPTKEVLLQQGYAAVEAWGLNAAQMLDVAPVHGLLMATHLAFGGHLPLVISPDDVWLCLAQGFAHHVHASGPSLHERLVRHEGKKELLIRRDEFVRGSPDNDWPGAVDELTAMMGPHIAFQRGLITEAFSTTGAVERAAAHVTLLASMQQYFHYKVRSFCGIPEVTLLGEASDWARIRTRAEVLGEFDLRWWTDALLPALDVLIASARGAPDRSRWESFYKHRSASGGDRVSGWINALFPYVQGTSDRCDRRNPWIVERAESVNSNAYPKGNVAAPFEWEFPLGSVEMEFGAGFVGVTQDGETGALRAVQGWWVGERAAMASGLKLAKERGKMRGNGGPWSPLPEPRSPRLPRDVDVVIEGNDAMVDLRRAGLGRSTRSVTIRGAGALVSLEGLPEDLTALVIEDAPRLRDIDPLWYCERVTLVRCGALEDLRAIHLGARHTLTIRECPLVGDEWQGTFAGDDLVRWKQRYRKRFGFRP